MKNPSADESSSLTRRRFIRRVAHYGGSAFAAASALGFVAQGRSRRRPPLRKQPLQEGEASRRVIILGAGLAGMAAARRLRRAGHTCHVLEARDRPGGRCWTVRGGTSYTNADGAHQTARFDRGHYMNPGPARIPHHHEATLAYCRDLGVELEVFPIINKAAYYYHEGDGPLAGERLRLREIETDMEGYTSELLAKAVDKDRLDTPMNEEDEARLVEYLRQEGGLDPDLFYEGSSSRGYDDYPGAGTDKGKVGKTLSLKALIESGFADETAGGYVWMQPTMFQPKGGMDQIAYALAEEVADLTTYRATVTGIRKTAGGGVRVTYDRAGQQEEVRGDYCVCTIPLSVLRRIPADFSPAMEEAIAGVEYSNSGKIGLQFARRFWEEDDQIYGGLSRTNMDITQVWYPNYKFLSDKGVLIGYYNFGDTAQKMGNLSIGERRRVALKQGSKIHPQYAEEFENAFSLAWQKVPYNRGGWASYTEATRKKYYPTLIEPDGPIYLAGEHTSYLTAWMAGAFESAERVADDIHSRALSASN